MRHLSLKITALTIALAQVLAAPVSATSPVKPPRTIDDMRLLYCPAPLTVSEEEAMGNRVRAYSGKSVGRVPMPSPPQPPVVFDEPTAMAYRTMPAPPPAPPAPPARPAPPATSVAMSQPVAEMAMATTQRAMGKPYIGNPFPQNREKYAHKDDNRVQRTADNPVSTFSVDVDTGSYTNVRRMICSDNFLAADAVRAEEFLNYFDFNHPAPTSRAVPFRVTTELSQAVWNPQREVMMIGIKGYDVDQSQLPPANLVFLIDTSGSMDEPNKLPLVKYSMEKIISQLRPQDRVSIVTYAGSAGLVLEPTSGANKNKIRDAIKRMDAGGSTNGGEGIELAYATAKKNLMNNGINRIILATDGDFNVGTVNTEMLKNMVADQRKSGVSLTTLGFGSNNYNDELSEQLANIGNGNHAYIDSPFEADRVMRRELNSTLFTIAKDVKIQVEFNPALVSEYRLIGYENRMLNEEDFANDQVDAGEIGAGHSITAIYEITRVGSGADRLPTRKYSGNATPRGNSNELATVSMRYKLPNEESSKLLTYPIAANAGKASQQLKFASAVVGAADYLKGGRNFDGWNLDSMIATAYANIGNDPDKTRQQFAGLMQIARAMKAGEVSSQGDSE